MAGRPGDEAIDINEPILDQATQSEGGENSENNPNKVPNKPAWSDQNDQYTGTTFTVAAGVLLQPFSGDELEIHLITKLLASLLFLLYLSTGALMLCKFFSVVKPSSTCLKRMILLLNLLVAATLVAANAAFLGLVDKSFLPLVSVPILGFVLVAIVTLFYCKVEPDHEDEADDEENEAMVKRCFKVANYATTTGFGAQIAVVHYCLKNRVSLKNNHQYSIIAAFVTSTLGVFSSTMTSSPLQFQSELICRLLKQLPVILLFLQGMVSVFISTKFLDPVKEVFAIGIPFIIIFVVNLCQKDSKELKVVEDDSNSMYGQLANFGIAPILAIYLLKLESNGCNTTYLSYSVFFLLLAILMSLMRTAFRFGPARTALEHVTNAVPMVVTVLGVVVGVVLLLIECYMYEASNCQAILSPSPHALKK